MYHSNFISATHTKVSTLMPNVNRSLRCHRGRRL